MSRGTEASEAESIRSQGRITGLGRAIWLKVVEVGKYKRRARRPSDGEPANGTFPSHLICNCCGKTVSNGGASYCRNKPGIFAGKVICVSCQEEYHAF